MQEKVDVLNRDEFVNRVYNLIKVITENKKSCSFAIDGKWGSGKSFVLEKLQNQLEREQSEELNNDRYFVCYYDCWKYDYYDEPIISIITSMMQTIEDKQKIVSEEIKQKFLDKTKKVLQWVGCGLIKKKFGLDIKDLANDILDSANIEKGYDKYYGFQQILEMVRDWMQEIADIKQTIIIVDEMDRCLPTYAIQVLERLHHIFDGLNNVIVIIAMDKIQMSESLKTIYGNNLDVDMYLKKFISFTLYLEYGMANKFLEKYEEYASLFNIEENDKGLVETFFSDITYEIDIRTQEKIFEKAETMHRILAQEKKMDAAIMLFEVLLLCNFEKTKSYSMKWIIEGTHHVEVERKVGKIYYEKITEYRKQYLTSNEQIGWKDTWYLNLRNTVISRGLFLVASINASYEAGYCVGMYIQEDLGKEVDFVKQVHELLIA